MSTTATRLQKSIDQSMNSVERDLLPTFDLPAQEQDHWCWAAVAAAVRSFLGSSNVVQCQVATEVLPGDCCRNPGRGNVDAGLQAALGETLREYLPAQVPFDAIQQEIDANHPVCARVVWDADRDGVGESAHFVVIHGYEMRDTEPYLHVKDPLNGISPNSMATSHTVHFDDFRFRYLLMGTWLQTYLVK